MHSTEYHVRIAGYGVITDGDRILLAWYNGEQGKADPGWSLPGGGIEFDEPLSAGVVREVLEETGYTVELGTLEEEGTTDFARWVPMAALADQPLADIVMLALRALGR